MNNLTYGSLLAACLAFAPASFAQDSGMAHCPMHQQHMGAGSHQGVVQQHGDEAMGFSHETTTHHFRMNATGGAIEVTANNSKDTASQTAIRDHLEHITVMFSGGDFSIPMFVHDSVPPGVTTMKLLKEKITYTYEAIPSGGRVMISSTDPLAQAGIHDFLRFQIADHQTGDAVEVSGAAKP
jgi:hypothetical protein